jgi:hypothetical protein
MGRVPNLVLKTIIEEAKETFQVPHLKVSEDTIKTRLKRSKQKEENACELDVLLAKTHIIPPSQMMMPPSRTREVSNTFFAPKGPYRSNKLRVGMVFKLLDYTTSQVNSTDGEGMVNVIRVEKIRSEPKPKKKRRAESISSD